MIIENDLVPDICSAISGMSISAVTVFLWVFVKPIYMADKGLITHESIHIEQYKETFFLGFFLIYAYDFIRGIFRKESWAEAYMNTRFEKEAYENQYNEEYLITRKKYCWA